MMGPCEGGADIDLELQIEPWDWQGGEVAPDSAWGHWIVNDDAHTADLTIAGWNDQWGGYIVEKWNIPVIWNTPTLYVISSWDMIDWWLTSAVATFTF